MSLTGKRVAVLVADLYQVLEVWYPYYRLVEAGATVHLVGPVGEKEYPSKEGYPAKTHKAGKDVLANDYDAVVIPGGFAPDYIRRFPEMIQFVQGMDEQKKPLAAICHGPWVLCSTKALRGRNATCFMAIKDDVINAGATYVDEECVVDGHVITSRKPDDMPAFMRALIGMLEKA